MSELGASISIGVLAALVVLIVYLIAARVGRWQPAPQRRVQGAQTPPQQGYGQGGYSQPGHGPGARPRGGYSDQPTRAYDQPTRAYNQPERVYGMSEDETRVLPAAGTDSDERATKAQLRDNIGQSGQMVEANRRAATSSNGDTLAVFTYIFGAALIAVIAFVFFNNLLLPATVGALAGAIICVALASTYTLKSLEFWPDNSTITIINLLVALAAAVAMFIGAERTERDGYSLGRITDSFAALPFSEGFTGFVTAIADRVVEFFREFGFMGFVFLLLMGAGCIIVVTLAAKSLIDVMDWRIFAQFGRFVTDRPMSHSRAVRFQASKVSHTVTSIILAGIAVLCATGMAYDGFTWFTR
ncbi:hypothetical protein SAMN04489751_2286 [Brevibacterium sandarakinum]|uniref:Uncharacterized protein n=1 Tax=Brevibacterium sandarakinum TaxID=629680 RepID=A0A1H1T600_BRESA|nr:hypothetical protein [Brevibacterium sandarakinum]SDS55672.1 hypothetical protein SAMN04489751_2286 [Brevibacterium sandarakinum]